MCLQVDMTWSGHVHVYERTCPILYHECLGYTAAGIPNAPVHMAIGNGGVSPTDLMRNLHCPRYAQSVMGLDAMHIHCIDTLVTGSYPHWKCLGTHR